VKRQKKEEEKPVEVEGVEEWEVEKILNKRKVRGVTKYLVQWKGFTAENDSWKKEKNLKNTKKEVADFEERINIEVRRQKRLDWAEEKDYEKGRITREVYGKTTI